MGYLRSRPATADLDELIAAAKADPNDCSVAMNEIVRRFQDLAWKLANNRTRSHDLRPDRANAALVELVRAVRSYRGPTSFPSYAKVLMRYAVHREHKRWIEPEPDHVVESHMIIRRRSPRPDDVTVDPTAESVLPTPAVWNGHLVRDVVAQMDPTRQELVHRRYGLELTVTEIAQADGVSTSAITQRLSTVHRQLEQLLAA